MKKCEAKNYPERKVKFSCGKQEEVKVFSGSTTSSMIDHEFLWWLRKNGLASWEELRGDGKC